MVGQILDWFAGRLDCRLLSKLVRLSDERLDGWEIVWLFGGLIGFVFFIGWVGV